MYYDDRKAVEEQLRLYYQDVATAVQAEPGEKFSRDIGKLTSCYIREYLTPRIAELQDLLLEEVR